MGSPPVEVSYRGRIYRRYPDGPRHAAVYFYATGEGAGSAEPLHRQVYIDTNGPIPEGHHVHHLDLDPFNNDPSNLEALSPSDHKRVHGVGWNDEARRAHLDRVRPLAAEWHRSEEGIEWHRQHGAASWLNRAEHALVCVECGEEFTSLVGSARFCSQTCRNRAWVPRPEAQESRVCEFCGESFLAERRKATRFCGVVCRNRATSRACPGGVRPGS